MTDSALSAVIDAAFERRTELSPKSAPAEIRDAVDQAIALLDSGKARVAEKQDGQWRVNQWLKKAVLLSFRLNDNRPIDAGFTRFYDKVRSSTPITMTRASAAKACAWCRTRSSAAARTSRRTRS